MVGLERAEAPVFIRFVRNAAFATVLRVLAYAVTIFAGAFLLFQVQPLMGKFILPWFGGGPAVWSACMLFFQAALLLGYAYAHASTRWLRPTTQPVLHTALLIVALALLPITPDVAWRPSGSEAPTIRILLLLAATIGLPYLVLASTGPLIQRWFSCVREGVSPYRLYALSNAGSLIALVSYPFVVEPSLPRKLQAEIWSWGFLAYAVLCAGCAWHFARRGSHGAEDDRERPAIRTCVFSRTMWLALPAVASVLLLSVTNKLCLDVAVVPFLWIAPLVVYLLSFIMCFDSPRWYHRLPFSLLWVGAMAALAWAIFDDSNWPLWRQVAVYCGGLFICCMVLHGELYRLRPEPQLLTSYYLSIAAGGALGGLLVATVAPAVFADYFELHFGLVICALLVLVCFAAGRGATAPGQPAPEGVNTWRILACSLTVLVFVALDQLIGGVAGQAPALSKVYIVSLRVVLWLGLVVMAVSWIIRGRFRAFPYWRGLACTWLLLGTAGLAAALWTASLDSRGGALYRSRNFYGVLSVREYNVDDPLQEYVLLQHGRITHGFQFTDPEQSKWPTTYYSEQSGIGLALKALSRPRCIGVVGLGTGTIAAHAGEGDRLRIYEINPEVIRLAKSHFSYLEHCAGQIEVVPGDARLTLEREPARQFDLIALDAFSSDAIPVHLLTTEAFETYSRHLRTNGIIAVHISNHFLDLEPVVRALAREFGFKVAVVDEEEDEERWWIYGTTWMLLSRSPEFFRKPEIIAVANPEPKSPRLVGPWSDDFSSLWQVLQK